MLKKDEKVEVKQEPKGTGIARQRLFFPSIFSYRPYDFFMENPFEIMKGFVEEMDRTFENFDLLPKFGKEEMKVWAPVIEVFEKDNKFIVRADLPGMTKDEVKVELTDEGLIFRGERKCERKEEEKEKGFYRSEMSYGKFYRFIPLPEGADINEIEAKFDKGVLEVMVPIPEVVQKRREVPIKETAEKQVETATGAAAKG